MGFTVPTALSLSAVKDAMTANPLASSFELKVNPYVVDRAESIAESFDIPVRVVSEPRMGVDEWLLSPQHEFGRF